MQCVCVRACKCAAEHWGGLCVGIACTVWAHHVLRLCVQDVECWCCRIVHSRGDYRALIQVVQNL